MGEGEGIRSRKESGEPNLDRREILRVEEVLENSESGEMVEIKKAGQRDSRREVGQRKPGGHRRGDGGAIADWDLVTEVGKVGLEMRQEWGS